MHALVTADSIGGVWTYVRELVTGLVRRGVRVTLVNFGQIPSGDQVEWLEKIPVDFRPTGFRLEWMQDAPEDLALSTEYLLSVVRETQPDILHLNQYAYGALDVSIPKLVVAHSDVMSWWMAVHGEEPRETRWSAWYCEIVRRGLAGAAAVVAPSQWMLDALCSRYLGPARHLGPAQPANASPLARPANITVIHNGRTPALFHPHISKEDCVVSAGRLWDGGKQISLLSGIDPPFPVQIAGSNEHPDSAVPSHGRQATGNRVELRGRLTEKQMQQLYGRAAIYVATSQYEPFGLAPLEAALSRCALVLNDIPTFHELWGDSACYFRYNDAQSLADTLKRLAEDRESRIAYANLAYHRARQCFTTDHMVDAYMGLYQSLVRTEAEAA
jgi:glycosyltransferase involved in cell wall biosynthesis